MEERQRQTITDLFRAGQTPKAIFKVIGFPRSTVYRTVAKLEAGGDASRAIHKGRNDVKRTFAVPDWPLKVNPRKSEDPSDQAGS